MGRSDGRRSVNGTTLWDGTNGLLSRSLFSRLLLSLLVLLLRWLRRLDRLLYRRLSLALFPLLPLLLLGYWLCVLLHRLLPLELFPLVLQRSQSLLLLPCLLLIPLYVRGVKGLLNVPMRR
jgi:hypothetical protein